MEARQPNAGPGGKGLVGKLDQRIVLVGAIVLLLGVFGFASTQSHDASATQSAADALTSAPTATVFIPSPTATPRAHHSKPAAHVTPAALNQGAAQTAANPVTAHGAKTPTKVAPTATPSTEAQTPLVLSDPTVGPAAPNTPWWQTALDVTWKLGLVVGLIYLAMRALAAFKKHGFTAKAKGPRGQRFFEQIEEITLAPQHSLHAVRAGDRILLLARTGGNLRALGEVDSGEADVEHLLAAGGFNNQLMRAWAGILPPSAAEAATTAEVEADAEPEAPQAPPAPKKEKAKSAGVIDAQWVTVEASPTPSPSPSEGWRGESSEAKDALPVRKGTARPSDKPAPPEQMDASTEREILFYAEENGVSAAAEKFGLTRQRVTAMRARHERDRMARKLQQEREQIARRPHLRDEAKAAPATPKPRPAKAAEPARPTTRPDHPRSDAAEPFVPLTARANLARNAYQGATATAAKPDTANTPTDGQALTVGQVLAARFGLKVPPGE